MRDLQNRIDRVERQHGAAPDEDDNRAWHLQAAAELRAALEALPAEAGDRDPNGILAQARARMDQMAKRQRELKGDV